MPILTSRGRRVLGVIGERGKRYYGNVSELGRDAVYGTTQPPLANYNLWYMSFDGSSTNLFQGGGIGEYKYDLDLQIDSYSTTQQNTIACSAGTQFRCYINTDGTINFPSPALAYINGVAATSNTTAVPIGTRFTLTMVWTSTNSWQNFFMSAYSSQAPFLPGRIWGVKYYNQDGSLRVSYDFTTGNINPQVVNASLSSATLSFTRQGTFVQESSPAHVVQYVGSASSGVVDNSLIFTIPNGVTTTAGNSLLLLWSSAILDNSVQPLAITDSKGNTWTSDVLAENTNGAHAQILRAPITTALVAGDTITATYRKDTSGTGVQNKVFEVYEVSGIPTDATAKVGTGSMPASVTNQVGTVNPNVSYTTQHNLYNFVVGIFSARGTTADTLTDNMNGWTDLSRASSSGGTYQSQVGGAFIKDQTSGTQLSYNVTLGTSRYWAAVMVEYNSPVASGGGGATNTPVAISSSVKSNTSTTNTITDARALTIPTTKSTTSATATATIAASGSIASTVKSNTTQTATISDARALTAATVKSNTSTTNTIKDTRALTASTVKSNTSTTATASVSSYTQISSTVKSNTSANAAVLKDTRALSSATAKSTTTASATLSVAAAGVLQSTVKSRSSQTAQDSLSARLSSTVKSNTSETANATTAALTHITSSAKSMTSAPVITPKDSVPLSSITTKSSSTQTATIKNIRALSVNTIRSSTTQSTTISKTARLQSTVKSNTIGQTANIKDIVPLISTAHSSASANPAQTITQTGLVSNVRSLTYAFFGGKVVVPAESLVISKTRVSRSQLLGGLLSTFNPVYVVCSISKTVPISASIDKDVLVNASIDKDILITVSVE